MTEPLGRYVQPDISEPRLARIWGNVVERLQQRRPARRWAWALAASAVVAGGAFAGLHLVPERHAATSALEQAAFETGRDASRVALADGSKIELASETRLDVAQSTERATRFSLRRGGVTCDVAHVPGRVFSVDAGQVQVRVIGTKFTLRRTLLAHGESVEVSVERGVVEVTSQRQPQALRLGAGQSYREEPLPRAPASTRAPEAAVEGESLPALPTASAVSARDLFDEGNRLRRQGEFARAADSYESLLGRFPADPRAGLVAFELGRLKMDSLNDVAGAASAFERAVTMAPTSTFREDAIARLVGLYQRMGRHEECRRAKQRYLKSYPQGVHRETVTRACE